MSVRARADHGDLAVFVVSCSEAPDAVVEREVPAQEVAAVRSVQVPDVVSLRSSQGKVVLVHGVQSLVRPYRSLALTWNCQVECAVPVKPPRSWESRCATRSAPRTPGPQHRPG